MGEPSPDHSADDHVDTRGDAETMHRATRHRYTNDLMAGVLVLFAIAATLIFIHRGEAVPLWLATVDTVAIASGVYWAFGKEEVAKAKELVDGNQ